MPSVVSVVFSKASKAMTVLKEWRFVGWVATWTQITDKNYAKNVMVTRRLQAGNVQLSAIE